MKILWLVNIVMPELAVHLGRTPSVFGGWLTGAMAAVKQSDNELVICTTEANTTAAGRYGIDGVTYYLTDCNDDEAMRREFRTILQQEQPDIVHIYGTEYIHSWAMAQEVESSEMLVTIQGCLYFIKNCLAEGIPEKYCTDRITHKILRYLNKKQIISGGGVSIDNLKECYSKLSEFEIKTIRKTLWVNGGSEWGNVAAKSINPNAKVLNCRLMLRNTFYCNERWSRDQCDLHTIYVSCTAPYKSFHKLLEAMPFIINRYPDAKIIAVGKEDSHGYGRLKNILRKIAPGYTYYIEQKIKDMNLTEHIQWVGTLTEEQVKEHLLKAHVFVSASVIENQSTALGEAMILGVPSVASCVGAMQEMIVHGEDGFLYPFHEPYLLAHCICRIFDDDSLAEKFSVNGQKHASFTYSKEINSADLIKMYKTIYEYNRNEKK